MVIKNTTTYTDKTLEKAAIASNYNNEIYKKKKLLFNFAGLTSGMVMVSIMARNFAANESINMIAVILFGIICIICLFIGMYYLDKNKYMAFREKYSSKAGQTFYYEIDSENIEVKKATDDRVTIIHWQDIKFLSEDKNNIYLFSGEYEWEALSKEGFTSCTYKDLKQLYKAILWEKSTKM